MNWKRFPKDQPPKETLLLCHSPFHGIVLAKWDGDCFYLKKTMKCMTYKQHEEFYYPHISRWMEVPPLNIGGPSE